MPHVDPKTLAEALANLLPYAEDTVRRREDRARLLEEDAARRMESSARLLEEAAQGYFTSSMTRLARAHADDAWQALTNARAMLAKGG